MPMVKSAREIAEKFTRVTPGRQDDFTSGVKDPAVDWATAARGAKASFEAGIQDALARDAFSKGVEGAGTDKWRRKVVEVGVGRWGAGVRAAGSDFQTAMEPVVEVIQRTTLPARAPRGDPRNIDRAAAMARALAELRRGR